MDTNSQVIEKFYSAFQRLDYRSMNECYAEDIVFSDPVFMILRGDQVRSMWEMLCTNAKEFSLEFSNIQSVDEEYYTCSWIARYTFSKTGNKVVNNARAFMRIRDGKIIEHSDGFRLSKWISQALGWKGVWFGWTGFMKRAVQKNARKALEQFMKKSCELIPQLLTYTSAIL